MNSLKDLNTAVDYIETHLTETLNAARIAQIAGCSEYQLLRMFPYLTGIGLKEYIRKRRMSQAARDLMSEEIQIVDLAARYGYASPTAFTRAFRAEHGITPQQARRGAVRLILYPRLTFQLSVKGAKPMEYRIENLSEFRAVGILDPDWSNEGKTPSAKATAFWCALGNDVHRVLDLIDGSNPSGLLGLSFCDEQKNTICYMAAVATNATCPENMTEHRVPAATYAVFECRGAMPEAMSDLWHNIMSEWLPSSGFEWDGASDFERYLTPNMTAIDAVSEVWIPVHKSNTK